MHSLLTTTAIYLLLALLMLDVGCVLSTSENPATEEYQNDAPEEGHYPLRCLVRQFNFTATVTDANGKQCRGQVSTKACFGSCDSYEVGTFEFPWIVRVQPVCNYDGVIMKEARLRDCDPGIDAAALIYRFPEASSCSCSICDPKEQACETTPSKRSGRPIPLRSRHRKISVDMKPRNAPMSSQEGTISKKSKITYQPYFEEKASAWLQHKMN